MKVIYDEVDRIEELCESLGFKIFIESSNAVQGHSFYLTITDPCCDDERNDYSGRMIRQTTIRISDHYPVCRGGDSEIFLTLDDGEFKLEIGNNPFLIQRGTENLITEFVKELSEVIQGKYKYKSKGERDESAK